jgi:hypothetical protein
MNEAKDDDERTRKSSKRMRKKELKYKRQTRQVRSHLGFGCFLGHLRATRISNVDNDKLIYEAFNTSETSNDDRFNARRGGGTQTRRVGDQTNNALAAS